MLFGAAPTAQWVKKTACHCRSCGFDPCAGKVPWWKAGQPTPVFLPGKSHGQRSLDGYSPGGFEKLDTTERLSLSLSNAVRSTKVK